MALLTNRSVYLDASSSTQIPNVLHIQSTDCGVPEMQANHASGSLTLPYGSAGAWSETRLQEAVKQATSESAGVEVQRRGDLEWVQNPEYR